MYPYRFGKENIFSAESTGHSDREMILKRLQRFWEENEGEGYLSASPTKRAIKLMVTVTKDLGDGYGLSMTVESDENGNVGKLRLPAPSRAARAARPYTAYDVQVSAPEYLTKRLTDVAIIEGITSQQPVELQPTLMRSFSE